MPKEKKKVSEFDINVSHPVLVGCSTIPEIVLKFIRSMSLKYCVVSAQSLECYVNEQTNE